MSQILIRSRVLRILYFCNVWHCSHLTGAFVLLMVAMVMTASHELCFTWLHAPLIWAIMTNFGILQFHLAKNPHFHYNNSHFPVSFGCFLKARYCQWWCRKTFQYGWAPRVCFVVCWVFMRKKSYYVLGCTKFACGGGGGLPSSLSTPSSIDCYLFQNSRK